MRNNKITTVQEKEEIEFTAKKPEEVTYLALKLPKKVTWAEDTVNNEHMGHKKSNICCIYHRPKLSPDDSDTSSCDSCDEKGKNAYERPNHYDRKISKLNKVKLKICVINFIYLILYCKSMNPKYQLFVFLK